MWYKNFTQKGDVKHNFEFFKTFSRIKAFFFSKMDKKEIAKKRQTLQNEGFFLFKKVEKTKKSWRCES